jgi:hypothetical protein
MSLWQFSSSCVRAKKASSSEETDMMCGLRSDSHPKRLLDIFHCDSNALVSTVSTCREDHSIVGSYKSRLFRPLCEKERERNDILGKMLNNIIQVIRRPPAHG